MSVRDVLFRKRGKGQSQLAMTVASIPSEPGTKVAWLMQVQMRACMHRPGNLRELLNLVHRGVPDGITCLRRRRGISPIRRSRRVDHSNNADSSNACAASGAVMFQNPIQPLNSNVGLPALNSAILPRLLKPQPSTIAAPPLVPVRDIYQAAKNRAIEDHELDKLFNPEYYDFQI